MAVKAKAKTRASKAKPAAKAAKVGSPAKAAKPKPVEQLAAETVVETDPEWIKAREDYANRAITVASIAKRFGLSQIEMSMEAKRRGWPSRTKTSKAAPETAATETPKPPGLVRSVFKTIEGELRKLDSHQGTTSQDRERASRALSQMVSSLEKAVEMQSRIDKTNAKGSKTKDKEQLAHAEDLRRAIAERLERLNSKRDAGRKSAASE